MKTESETPPAVFVLTMKSLGIEVCEQWRSTDEYQMFQAGANLCDEDSHLAKKYGTNFDTLGEIMSRIFYEWRKHPYSKLVLAGYQSRPSR